MHNPTTKSALLAAAMAVSMLGSGVVLADSGRYHENRYDSGHHRDYGHEKRYHKYYRHGGHHDRGYYGRGHGGRHVTNYYEYDDDDNDDLLIGLAIGGLLGYAINHADHE